MDGPIEEVMFAARYKDWLVVKKLLILENTLPEEIAITLASIDKTLVRKSYEYTGINTVIIEAYALTVVKKESALEGCAPSSSATGAASTLIDLALDSGTSNQILLLLESKLRTIPSRSLSFKAPLAT